METFAHARLKALAATILYRNGCAAVAVEVRCPIARHRLDAAGYLDPLPKRRPAWTDAASPARGERPLFERNARARTVIIECKQSRADFLTDSRDAEELLVERERLERIRRTLEDQILKACEPQLRQSGTRLFAELEDWDFSLSRVASYRAVLRDLRRVDQRLHGESKFWTLAYYRLADWLYLAAPPGVIRSREVPTGWGLIEFSRDALDSVVAAVDPVVRVPAPELTGRPDHRQRLLRNIAAAATRDLLRAHVPEENGAAQEEAEPSLNGSAGVELS